MKNQFLLLALTVLLLPGVLTANFEKADVKTYLLPHEAQGAREAMELLFKNVKKRIFVAAYRLTDPTFIGYLIDAKNRGVDVQVIIDSGSRDKTKLIEHFLTHNIALVISPFAYLDQILMHNKFVVFDDLAIMTGSANVTKKGLGTAGPQSNFENIVILYSKKIAQKYSENFMKIQSAIFDKYMKILTKQWSKRVPSWAYLVAQALYKKNTVFWYLVKHRLKLSDKEVGGLLYDEKYLSDEEAEVMASQAASSDPEDESFDMEALTDMASQRPSRAQINILRQLGLNPEGLSYGVAYDLIKRHIHLISPSKRPRIDEAQAAE